MTGKPFRIAREKKTVAAMVRLHCDDLHESGGEVCPECGELLEYAGERLDKCPYQEDKTTCAKCPIHCYKPSMRERVRVVMKYAGPRMLLRHPVLALFHLIDSLRAQPRRPLPRSASKKKSSVPLQTT